MDLSDCIMNAPERQEYVEALEALKPVLIDLPFKIIAIDGRPGVGKTTLGRFLAWRFNISLIETDLFLIRNQKAYIYRSEEIKSLIEHRREMSRPVVVDGIVSLKILDELSYRPDFHIHVKCEQSISKPLQEFSDYTEKYKPSTNSDLVLNLPVHH